MYNLKSKKDFSNEFDLQKAVFLGKGAYGKVLKCESKL